MNKRVLNNIVIYFSFGILIYIFLLKIGLTLFNSVINEFPNLEFTNFIMMLPRFYRERNIFGIILYELIIFSMALYIVTSIYTSFVEKIGTIIMFKLGKIKYIELLLVKTIKHILMIILLVFSICLFINFQQFHVSMFISLMIKYNTILLVMGLFLMLMITFKSGFFSIITTALVYGLINMIIYVYFNLLFNHSYLSLTLLLLITLLLNGILVSIFRSSLLVKEIDFL